MEKKQKIYMRTIYEEGDKYIDFGTRDTLRKWKTEKRKWKSDGNACDQDTIKRVATFDGTNLNEIIELVSECARYHGSN